jgi:hypothetical protein
MEYKEKECDRKKVYSRINVNAIKGKREHK